MTPRDRGMRVLWVTLRHTWLHLCYIWSTFLITSDSSCFQVRGVPVGDVVLLESTIEVLPQSEVVSVDFLCSCGFKRFYVTYFCTYIMLLCTYNMLLTFARTLCYLLLHVHYVTYFCTYIFTYFYTYIMLLCAYIMLLTFARTLLLCTHIMLLTFALHYVTFARTLCYLRLHVHYVTLHAHYVTYFCTYIMLLTFARTCWKIPCTRCLLLFIARVYSRSNSTKSPASGAHVSEPRLMSQVGAVREVVCA